MSEAPEQNMPGAGGRQIKTGDNCPVTVSESHIPETGKERTVIVILFALLMLCLVVIVIDIARNTRHDQMLQLAEDRASKAETDLKTQVWLRSDSLTKENADIRGHVIAIEDLIQSYGMGRNIPRPPPMKEEKH